MNVGNSKVMRCSRCVNVGEMDVRCNGETLEDVNYFKQMGLQVAVEEGSTVIWDTE